MTRVVWLPYSVCLSVQCLVGDNRWAADELLPRGWVLISALGRGVWSLMHYGPRTLAQSQCLCLWLLLSHGAHAHGYYVLGSHSLQHLRWTHLSFLRSISIDYLWSHILLTCELRLTIERYLGCIYTHSAVHSHQCHAKQDRLKKHHLLSFTVHFCVQIVLYCIITRLKKRSHWTTGDNC